MADPNQNLRSMSKETLQLLFELLKPLASQDNNTEISNGFRLKQVFWKNYAFFSFMYGLLGGLGVCLNLYLLIKIIRLKLYRNSLYYFYTHIACVNLFSCSIVLPVSLAILLSRYWIFGNFMCYAVIMIQDMPNRLVLLTFVLISVDRYRRFTKNVLESFPRHLALAAVWIMAVCLSLPAGVFVQYYDLGAVLKFPKLNGLGVCAINNLSIEEYSRVMFLVLYVCPLGVIAFAFTRISMELSKQDGTSSGGAGSRHGAGFADGWDDTTSTISLNLEAQNRIQRYLTAAVVVLFFCTLPLNVLFLIQCAIKEDDLTKMANFDVLYAVLVWLSFVNCTIIPAICLAMLNDGRQFLFWDIFRKNYANLGYYRRRLTRGWSSFISANRHDHGKDAGSARSRDTTLTDLVNSPSSPKSIEDSCPQPQHPRQKQLLPYVRLISLQMQPSTIEDT